MVLKIRVGEQTLSANETKTVGIDIPEGVRFSAHKLHFKSTGSFKIIRIYDKATNQTFSAGAWYSDMIKDRSANVCHFPVPLEVTGPTTIMFEVTDTSGSSNTVVIGLMGEEA